MNKYNRWYNNIIENARTRIIQGYKENHHIVPRSIGGTNDFTNLVELTAREHFICHWLLVKIHTGPEKHKMIYALNGMKRNGKNNQRYETPITSRVYEKLKIEFGYVHSQTMKGCKAHNKGKPMSEEQKAKIRATKAANPYKPSKESISKRLAKVIGRKCSEETKLKMSLSAKGKLKGPMSEEEKRKRSIALAGVKKIDGHAENVRKAVSGNVSIHKDNVEKKVKKEMLAEWLDAGWNIGGRIRGSYK